jgi:shikimate kinase
MGSGKSTVGKRLANRLKLDFIDLDKFIEKEEGKSIPQIFESQGEKSFRQLEKEYLLKLSEKKDVVISTGGGTPCFFDNIEFMNRIGTTIYLKMNVKALCNRLQNAKSERPLIKNFNSEELAQFVEKSLNERTVYYEKAKLIVNGENIDLDKLTASLT